MRSSRSGAVLGPRPWNGFIGRAGSRTPVAFLGRGAGRYSPVAIWWRLDASRTRLLADRVILITEATGGFGTGLSKTMADHCAKLALIGLDPRRSPGWRRPGSSREPARSGSPLTFGTKTRSTAPFSACGRCRAAKCRPIKRHAHRHDGVRRG